MKVFIIGAGGREHAIAWKLKQSEKVSAIYAAPGNPGIASIAETVDIKVDRIPELLNFAKQEEIDLTVVGPELPLTEGIVDAFQAEGLKIFGPSQKAAQLEGSKSFAKEVMDAAGVPTAEYNEFTELATLQEYLNESEGPIVLKADGLAAGKGVFVCLNTTEAESAARKLFQEFEAQKVIAEECLTGVEASYIVATDGKRIVPFASSHDYKRIFDDNQGPNTGGMGTVSPSPRISKEQEEFVLQNIISPVVQKMEDMGMPYQGFLYAGLMIDESGEIKVLEFNARLGDPEAQVILRRMQGDFMDVLLALVDQEDLPELSWIDDTAVCVVLASEGYPGKVATGDQISGINLAEQMTSTCVFHAGTAMESSNLITAGGRVLNVTRLGQDLDDSISKTYQAADCIQFRGMQLRRDIGK